MQNGTGATVSPRFAVITAEDNSIRFTRDASTPVEATKVGAVQTTTAALPLVLTGEAAIAAFRFVAVTAGAGRIHVDYYI